MASSTISAIVPTYNRRSHVVRAIDSIVRQRPAVNEIIVVDDGSTDGTSELLRRTFGDVVRVIEQANGGVSAARRRGVLEATGDWIAFLDSDDEWTEGRTSAFLSTIEAIPQSVEWLFGDTRIVEDAGHGKLLFQQFGLQIAHGPTVFDDALQTQYPFQFSFLQSSLIRRSLLLKTSAFSEDLRSSEDFLVSFRAAMNSKFAAIPEVVTLLYRTSDLDASSLDRTGKNSADYFRARMMAFGEAARRSGEPWSGLHESAVRGAWYALAHIGAPVRGLAFEQFRHRISLKGAAFAVASIFAPKLLLTRHTALSNKPNLDLPSTRRATPPSGVEA